MMQRKNKPKTSVGGYGGGYENSKHNHNNNDGGGHNNNNNRNGTVDLDNGNDKTKSSPSKPPPSSTSAGVTIGSLVAPIHNHKTNKSSVGNKKKKTNVTVAIASVKRNKCGTQPFDERWLNLDCCGLVCAGLTYALHFYGVYSFGWILLPPWFSVMDEDGHRELSFGCHFHRFAFVSIAFLAVLAHFNAMTTDPGAVPPDANPLPDPSEELECLIKGEQRGGGLGGGHGLGNNAGVVNNNNHGAESGVHNGAEAMERGALISNSSSLMQEDTTMGGPSGTTNNNGNNNNNNNGGGHGMPHAAMMAGAAGAAAVGAPLVAGAAALAGAAGVAGAVASSASASSRGGGVPPNNRLTTTAAAAMPIRRATTPTTQQPRGRRMCRRCQAFKPPRAHHCSICKRCIIKMDHHCPWVNNCVGIGNHKYFLLFIFYTSLSCAYSFLFVVYRVFHCVGHAGRHHHGPRCVDHPTDLLPLVGLTIEALLFGLFTFCMMVDQWDVVRTNLTHIDRLKGESHLHNGHHGGDPRRPPHHGGGGGYHAAGNAARSARAGINEVFGTGRRLYSSLSGPSVLPASGFHYTWLSPLHKVCFPDTVRDDILGYCRPAPKSSKCGGGAVASKVTSCVLGCKNEGARRISKSMEMKGRGVSGAGAAEIV